MSSTEMVWVGSVDDYPDQSRAARRRRRRLQSNRRFAWWAGTAAIGVFVVTFAWALKTQFAQPQAAANTTSGEPSDTTLTVPPPTPATTIPTPETLPAPVAPQWVTVKVAVPGWEGLGKLLTDGQSGHCGRTLPGEVGRAVLSIPFDPTAAGTVVVEGKEYRVETRGQVAANDLSICDVHPIWPTVLIVSSQPGDARPFVTARKP